MRFVLLAREGAAATLILRALSKGGEPALLVLESGRAARRRKLRRTMARGAPWRWPLTLLDLAAQAAYQRVWSRFLGARTSLARPQGDLHSVQTLREDDVNNPVVAETVRRLRADVVFVFGTSILRGDTLNLGSRYLLNIHGGIVPEYRNVHSEFWAVLHRDRENAGVSILHLDPGIDSGAVALQRRLPRVAGETFLDVRFRNLLLAAEAASEALDRIRDGRLAAVPQSADGVGFHPTPGFIALTRMLWRETRSRTGSKPHRSA